MENQTHFDVYVWGPRCHSLVAKMRANGVEAYEGVEGACLRVPFSLTSPREWLALLYRDRALELGAVPGVAFGLGSLSSKGVYMESDFSWLVDFVTEVIE